MNSESYSHLQGTYTRQANTIQSPQQSTGNKKSIPLWGVSALEIILLFFLQEKKLSQGGIEHNPGCHPVYPS